MAGLRGELVLSVNDTQAKRSVERSAAELNRIMGGVGKKQVNFNVNSRSFTQPLGRITGSANEFTKSLEASNARVIAFGASVGIINGISDAFKNLVAETVRFEKTLADVNVVLDASNSSLQRFGQGLFDVAKNTSQSFGVAAEAALEFSRQGLTMEEVLKRTNDALTLTRLTGLKAAEAVSGLTAAVNAFSSVGLTTTQVIDKLAAVDVKFAVSSEDLINALERTGAVAIDAGVELDSLIGLVTSLQQTTARGGAVIGNGLKTIFTRIQRPKSLAQIEALDIAVRNLSGAVLPADKILINIAKSFDTLTASQKSNVVQFSAGIFQANVFRAALRDLGKTQSIQSRATEVSAGAAGEAAMKNQKLNKTIAALASQSGTAVQELASAMGDLMVKPEIGGFLELFKGSVEGIRDMLGGGEEQGSTFAKGLVAGIGNILTGPAAIAFGAVFIKLFMNIAKFAHGSLADVLDIVTKKDKIRKIEESILETLSKNKDIQESLNNLDGDREQQGKFILKVIEAQTNAMREQEKLAAQLARPLLDAGVRPDLTVGGKGPVDLDGDGSADSFGARGVLPSSAKRERREASRGGYSPGAVDSMSIKGLGQVVYNKAEKVKQFPGMQQPAIMPPQGSRAGSAYKDAFSTKHGFDPYAAGGFIPNFAAIDGGALRLNQSKMHLYANPREAKPGGDAVRNAMKALVDSGKPVTVSATTDQLLKGESGSHTKAIKGLIRFIADQENGPKLFERDFKLTNLPWKGNKGEDASEDAVAKLLNKDGKKYINTGKRPGAHGDKTFPVDLIGAGLDPVEVKSGEWKQPNILLKSMRLYSDDELMQFAERQYGATPEMLKGARMEKLGKSARLLQGKGLLDPDASLEEQHDAAIKYGTGGGFVPSFAGGWGGGRANSGRLPKWEEALAKIESWAAIPGNGAPDKATILRETGVKWPKMRGVLGGKENDSTFVAAKKQLGAAKLKILQDFISNAAAAAQQGKSMTAADIGIWASSVKLKDTGDSKPRIRGADINAAFPGIATGRVDAFAGLATPLELTGKDLKNFNRATFRGQIDEKGLGKNKKGATADVQKLLSNTGIIPGWKDWEDLLMLKGYKGMSSNPLAPLDFTIPPAEAKWGAPKDKLKPEQIIGKLLRYQVGSGNFPGWGPQKSSAFNNPGKSFDVGSVDLLSVPKALGLVPNFAGDTTLYRGTSPKYQKAVPDRPNAPQFLFDKLLNAQTKIGFLSAVEELGTQHAKGKYSGSYNTDLKPATLEQMRGGEELGAGEIQHAGYVYKRPIKGQKKRTMPSGFVSKSKNRSVADRFSRALEFKHQGSHDQQGQIHEDKIPNNRILNKKALGKIVDRVGLSRVQKGFKRMMKNGTLKDLYLDLDKWRPKTEEGEERSSWDNTHKYRSIGHSGEGMTFDEEEVVQIWGKHSPYYGAGKGLVPNFNMENYARQVTSRRVDSWDGDLSGSVLNHRGSEIDWIRSNKKGEGHELFNSFLNEKGLVQSASINQTRSFKQGSKTNFEDLVYAFPQLQYRLKSNATTTGDFTHGPEREHFTFRGLKSLKSRVNPMNREGFQSALGAFPGAPGLETITIDDLVTTITKDKSKADDIYKNYAGGSIPNFADNRNRQQKISDVLSDPSNAGIKFKGGALKPRSIKSKNMFQKMWLESYFKTGLEGDYQMLMKMGYNPDELLSLRSFASKGGEVNILGKGFVPNFANPLREAIAREEAAGIPKSQIRVEQSGQLRGPGNPMGLAVTNKRDEPLGVGQGIRRARSMGMDPRRHGAASGMIPNFADGDEVEIPAALLKVLNDGAEAVRKALEEKIPEAAEYASEALKELPMTTEMDVRKESTEEGKLSAIKDALKKEGEKSGADQNPELIKKLEKAVSTQEGLIKAIEASKSAPGNMGDKISKTDGNAEKVIAAARKLEVEEIKRVALAKKSEQKAISGTIEELQNLQDALHVTEETAKDENHERSGGLQKLFYMQSAISMTNGFLEQFSEGARGATKTFLDLATAATSVTAAYIQQKEFVNQGMSMTGVGDNERGFSLLGGNDKARGQARATEAKIRGENLQARGGKGLGSIGKAGAMVGKLTRSFGRFLPIVGQLYTGFTVLDEGVKFLSKAFDLSAFGLEKGEGIMDLFASASTRATKRMEELSKTADSLKAALGGLETQEKEQIELRKLENKGTSRTIAEEKRYYDLRLKSIDTDIALSKAMGDLMNENKTGRRSLERINRVIGSTTLSMSEQKEGIRDLIIANQMLMAATSQRALFQEGIERADSDDDPDRLLALGGTRGVQVALATGPAFEGKKGASAAEKTEALSHNIRELEKAIAFKGGDAKGGLENLNFDTSEAVGSTGITEMLRGVIQDIDDFEWNTVGLSDAESKAYKKSIQELIAMLKKRKDAQSKGAKDDVDLSIASQKALELSLFNIKRERAKGKHEDSLALGRSLHATKLENIQSGILKDYEGISSQAHIELEAAKAASDRTAKYENDLKDARRSSIEALDKVIGKDLSAPGTLSGDIKTGLGNASQQQVNMALGKFQDRIEKGASFSGPLTVGGERVSGDELEEVKKAFATAAKEGRNAGDAILKLKALNEARLSLETDRLQAIFATMIGELKISELTDEKKREMTKLLDSSKQAREKLEQQNKLADEIAKQEKIKTLIAAKTVKGAQELYALLIGSKTDAQIRNQLSGVINERLQGEADTLAAINKYQKDRISIINGNLDFDRKAFETQKDKNRTEAESALMALRQLEYQEESLEGSEESAIIQEAKLRSEILTAGQSAKEAELRYKFLSDLTNRSSLIKAQIGAEMSGLRTAKMMNRDKLKQQIQGGELNEMAEIELREQETSLSTEALKNAQLAANLSHLKEAGSLTYMANRLMEKSNKLIEAQNASRQAVLSRGDLAFNTKADLITERSGAIGETRGAAMRALMTNSPEDALAFANSLEQTNKQLGHGSRAIDKLRSKMAELDVSAKNLGADLVELGLDGVRTGFKQLLNDIGSGAKSAGDAWRDFGLGMAKTLLDRITDHNIDRIVKDLTFAFTGVDPMSEAEKIASSNNHLVTANDKLISALNELEAEVARDEKTLEDKVGKPPPKDTPFDRKIKDKTDIELLQIKNDLAQLRAQIALLTKPAPATKSSLGTKANPMHVTMAGGTQVPTGPQAGLQNVPLTPAQATAIKKQSYAQINAKVTASVNTGIKTKKAQVAEMEALLKDAQFLPSVRAKTKVPGPRKGGRPTTVLKDTIKIPRWNIDPVTGKPYAGSGRDAKTLNRNKMLEIGAEHTFLNKQGFTSKTGINTDLNTQGSRNDIADYQRFAPEMKKALDRDLRTAIEEKEKLKKKTDFGGHGGTFDELATNSRHAGTAPAQAVRKIEEIQEKIRHIDKVLEAINKLPQMKAELSALEEQAAMPLLSEPPAALPPMAARTPFELKPQTPTLPADAEPAVIDVSNFSGLTQGESFFKNKKSPDVTKEEVREELNNVLMGAGIDPEKEWKKREANQGAEPLGGLKDEHGRDLMLWKPLTTAIKENTKAQGAVKKTDKIIADAGEAAVTTRSVVVDAANVSLNVGTLTIKPWDPTPTPADKQGGGIIQHFADGGFVKGPGGKDKVPAMLTAGEFVIPKKEVNRAFKFMGQNVRGSGDTIEGMRKNQSISSQSQEVRDILAAEGGRYVQKFNEGDKVEPTKPGFVERVQSGTQGLVRMAVMQGAADLARSTGKQKSNEEAPTFNMNKLNTLGIGSDVNLKKGDPRLSSRFLATDSTMEEYRGYLKEKADYDVAKTNEKYEKRMGIFKSIFGVLTSAGIGVITSNIIAPIIGSVTDYIGTKTENFVKGHLGLGKHSDTFKDLNSKFPDTKINYSDAALADRTGHLTVDGNVYDVAGGSWNDTVTINRGKTAELAHRRVEKAWTGLEKSVGEDRAQEILKSFDNNVGLSNKQLDLLEKHGIKLNDRSSVGSAIDFFNANRTPIKTKNSQGGGSIPAMLTAGEGYIPASIAKRIGYNNLSHMNNTGTMPIVKGKGGIDNVGPVGLNSGDFIMKKSSTNKLLRDNPNAMRFSLQGQSDGRRGAQGYYEGGIVGSELTVPARSLGPQKSQQGNRLQLLDQKESEKSDSGTAGSTTNAETTNNININISIDKAGAEVESQEGGEDSYEKERNLSMKIKGAVLEVIREEKRIGGELS